MRCISKNTITKRTNSQSLNYETAWSPQVVRRQFAERQIQLSSLIKKGGVGTYTRILPKNRRTSYRTFGVFDLSKHPHPRNRNEVFGSQSAAWENQPLASRDVAKDASKLVSSEQTKSPQKDIYMHTLTFILRKVTTTTAHATKSDADHIELTNVLNRHRHLTEMTLIHLTQG